MKEINILIIALENLIGKGGYAEVYKGCLSNGQSVAVKRLNKGVGEDEVVNFLTEIGIIAHVNHPNTAKMIGFGVEGGSFLILQLSSLGSLGSLLQGMFSYYLLIIYAGSKEKLDWSKRYKIIVGTAQGLLYLHEHCERRIIHRDIKADNILLSEDFEPQVPAFYFSIFRK
ncbi:PREDICTED: receptor-like cytosolic serine/threonine-protein kinase RBK2 [Erythranthe guttata]|uniref:receptor-like cytosolic serine/threonine-protein kinase RBK2 n=1 Tax=Erythranthe guttata TaxID=4155 RepID=UPI00064D82EF|nr:PREDICTED: receptor-like cytosolic serine/threonine-protein kinase RBK2 [Erythranthe guttata]|eukprot:XP_012837895.1 PREDICTED: receptor-like cytosolic serine/threonine-protein kinase RBK2 [Erythranthe guttata]